MDILERIEKLRKERGWSINNLAMEAALTQSTVNNIYARQTEPKISTLKAICGAFGMTLSEFFKEGESEKESDAEIFRRIRNLSEEQKKALLVILKGIK